MGYLPSFYQFFPLCLQLLRSRQASSFPNVFTDEVLPVPCGFITCGVRIFELADAGCALIPSS